MMSQRVKLLISILLTTRWSVNWWDEKRCHRQLRSKFRHQVSQPVKSGDITDSHTCHTNLGATSASELVGERTDRVTITSAAKHTSHPERRLLPEDRRRRANDHSFGRQCTNRWLPLPLEKKGNRDQLASRSPAAFARYVGPSQSDHPRRLGACTHGSHSRRMRTTDIRDTTHLTREQQRSTSR